MQHPEQSNSSKGLILSVSIHGVFLLLCYFYTITISFPKEETEFGGLVINYGMDAEGSGTDVFSIEETSTGPVADPNAKPEDIQNMPAASEKSSSNDNEVVTQDNEDAPVVNNESKSSTNTNTSTSTEPVNNTPTVDQRALFKGKKSTGTGGGDGTGTKPGNQGDLSGDPNSTNYIGGGDGTGGVALNLNGRRFLSKPTIQDKSQVSGKIVVQITVDRSGTITDAKAGVRGTTITNAALWSKCEKAVLGSKLNALNTGPDIQVGSVVFTFILE